MATSYGTTVQKIVDLNNISNPNVIIVGDKLTITGNQTTTAQKSAQVVTISQKQNTTKSYQNNSVTSTKSVTKTSNYTGTSSSAKAWIAQRESGGSYTATNSRYIGKYQLDRSYLKGDYSPANQEKVADNYVTSRYGSWEQAKAFWQANGWY